MGKDFSKRYVLSEQMLQRALKTIPLGSQTFSKSKTQYPLGISPYFIKRAKGSHVWDVDDNEYIDFVNALAAITLGYNDPDVTKAVSAQLAEGVIFTLPHELEIKVAEKITEMVPCAEMTRFGKNGSDATAGAIRLARAYTGRDHVAVCGYHGWQDWFIGSTTRNLGVPQSVRDLTHTFIYNDIESLQSIFRQYHGQVAAVIMEPMNVVEPEVGFLENVKEITHKNGSVFILDETITGFRYAKGGAQEYFGIIPDLATFGKGMANGYPVSAITGRADIMKLMEEIFFSFTFGGETLSLAAALATMTKLQREPVIETLWKRGREILSGTKVLIKKHGLDNAINTGGKECWSFLLFQDTDSYSQWELKTLFLQEVFARGILCIGTHNMSYAHTDEDVEKLLKVYDEVFVVIKEVITNGNLDKRLLAEPLVQLFKIR
jgi:glutamate-1-semialdehyde 2,1-aminomutase